MENTEIKENMCQTCSPNVPLAFMNDNMYYRPRGKNMFNLCNCFIIVIILIFLYLIFKK